MISCVSTNREADATGAEQQDARDMGSGEDCG